MAKQLILAIDQGTSSTKALLVDESLTPVASASVAISISSPQPGWVQQDASEILASVNTVIAELVEAAGQNPDWQIIGLALTNQRESALAWDAKTGAPLGPMLGWQDRRTEPELAKFNDATKAQIREITGLGLDPMFSALKLQWLLDQHDADRALSGSGQIMLGTVDAYLRYSLTGEHVVEIGNASRTQLLDISTGQWSASLCELFNLPVAALPTVSMSDAESAAVLAGPAKGLKILATLAHEASLPRASPTASRRATPAPRSSRRKNLTRSKARSMLSSVFVAAHASAAMRRNWATATPSRSSTGTE